MDDVTPLFIGGMGRSGTTNALRVLNTHPAVMLNGEVSLSVLKQFFALLDIADRSYMGSDETAEGWKSRKTEYMFESFGYLSKGGRGRLEKGRKATFRGHKTPRLESLFTDYETHFRGIGLKPRYFYCARNPFDCWRSTKMFSWGTSRSLEEFLKHYTTSFHTLDQMQQAIGERVSVIKLDELMAESDPLAWYRKKLFAPLGLDMPQKTIRRLEKLIAERTTSTAPNISDDERKTIASYPGIASLMDTVFTGYEMRSGSRA